VQRKTAIVLGRESASDGAPLTVASQTCVEPPRWIGVATAWSRCPIVAVPRWFEVSSTVVKPALPGGSAARQPYPHAVSARATTDAACR
jgi:hypothetical protein